MRTTGLSWRLFSPKLRHGRFFIERPSSTFPTSLSTSFLLLSSSCKTTLILDKRARRVVTTNQSISRSGWNFPRERVICQASEFRAYTYAHTRCERERGHVRGNSGRKMVVLDTVAIDRVGTATRGKLLVSCIVHIPSLTRGLATPWMGSP